MLNEGEGVPLFFNVAKEKTNFNLKKWSKKIQRKLVGQNISKLDMYLSVAVWVQVPPQVYQKAKDGCLWRENNFQSLWNS